MVRLPLVHRFSLFLVLIAFAAVGDDGVWMRDMRAAVARAKGEKKLVLLHVRASCRSCNETIDQLLAAEDPVTQRALADFVLVRLDEKADAAQIAQLERTPSPLPMIFFLDANGSMIENPPVYTGPMSLSAPSTLPGNIAAPNLPRDDPPKRIDRRPDSSPGPVFGTATTTRRQIRRIDTKQHLLRMLSAAAAATPALVTAAKTRAGGKPGAADMALANAYLQMQNFGAAAKTFERAENELREANDIDSAMVARAYRGLAVSAAGDRRRGIALVEEAIRDAKSNAASAEAWLAYGELHQLASRQKDAINAYRKAYDLAEVGSPAADIARKSLEQLGHVTVAPKQPVDPTRLSLAVPTRVATGNIDVEANAGTAITRVRFLLDDVPVGEATSRPFRTTLDLGRTPRLRTIKAIGYDAEGSIIDSAFTTVNDRADAFRVALTWPASDVVPGVARIEASVLAPPQRDVKSVELYWGKERIATLVAPPYRRAYPVNGRFGYIRAVATLDDGTTAEDTKLVNAGGVTESVDVQGASFLATIVDRHGKRVSGLTAHDVVVEEDGRRVEASVREASDEPATIGIAVDASSSMAEALPAVGDIAVRMVSDGLSPQDRVFVVRFDTQAALTLAPTSDRAAARDALLDLRAKGGTSIYDGIAFALRQFEGVAGKKALVVISDAKEGTSSADAAACIRLAKDIGVPIYAFIPEGTQAPTGMSSLQRLSADTGGVFFMRPKTEELPGIAATVRDEVRGQYQISFTSPQPPAKTGTWRTLRVTVPSRRDVAVRTIGGYWVR